jgi:hypothetical protein
LLLDFPLSHSCDFREQDGIQTAFYSNGLQG